MGLGLRSALLRVQTVPEVVPRTSLGTGPQGAMSNPGLFCLVASYELKTTKSSSQDVLPGNQAVTDGNLHKPILSGLCCGEPAITSRLPGPPCHVPGQAEREEVPHQGHAACPSPALTVTMWPGG